MAVRNTGEAAAGGGVRRRARTIAPPIIRRNPRRRARYVVSDARAIGGKAWIVAILKRARGLLAQPGAWLRNGELADCTRAADCHGRSVPATDPAAVRWTANAAIEWAAHTIAREAGIEGPERAQRAAGLALQAINPLAPVKFDPDTGHVIALGLCAYNADPETQLDGVLALFDSAIAETEAPPKRARKDAEPAEAAPCS